MMIVLTPLLAALFFRRRIEPLAWVGVLLATAGLAVISLRGLSLGIGEALTLLGALLFAGQIALLSEWPRPDEAYGTTVIQCAVATAVAGLPALLTGGIAAPPNAGVWGALVLMGLGAGALGFTVQAWAQAHLTATRAAIIMAMEPVFGGDVRGPVRRGADRPPRDRRLAGAGRDPAGGARPQALSRGPDPPGPGLTLGSASWDGYPHRGRLA